MPSENKLKSILEEIYPLHRTLASPGTEQALEIVKREMPSRVEFNIKSYSPGSNVWTWVIPERYLVHEAYLETEEGERILDFVENPLHLVSYSLPVEKTLSWEELEPHLNYSEKLPDEIPWEFKYYERDWGFCLSKNTFDKLDRKINYRAVIRSEFDKKQEPGFRLGAGVLHPEGGEVEGAGELLLCAHICHPMQANDDAAGVVTMVEVAKRLAAKPLSAGAMSVRFLICPETIGSITYLANHEEIIPNLRAGIFVEMTGNDNSLILQHSRQDDHLIDRVMRYVLKQQTEQFREGKFGEVIANDERVINGPGINVPCVSLSRWPYDEYHTSADNPSIISEANLQQAADVIEEAVRIYTSNYRPLRKFKGPVFLSGNDLWVDWRENWALNKAIEKIMYRFEGEQSIFEIAEELGLDYWETFEYVDKFREKGLVIRTPIDV